MHVTSAVYNYNGTEVLASYNDDNIYLFDTVSPQDMDFAHKYQGHRNNATCTYNSWIVPIYVRLY